MPTRPFATGWRLRPKRSGRPEIVPYLPLSSPFFADFKKDEIMTRVPFPTMKYPLIAILRGLKPEETEAAISALIEAEFTAIEIPLNSPDPFRSIEIAVKTAPANCLIGAGTVLTKDQVERLEQAGGRLFVSPNVDVDVIAHAASKGMVTMPGVFTPTEALAAAGAGATGLKFFPASVLGAAGISAIRAVLPTDLEIAAVGGVSEANFAEYAKIGVKSFGLGSSIYKVGMSAAEIGARARITTKAYDAVYGASA
ncbi:2-keto-3-deoxy-phosphogalactonate aldolase [Rhizobium sp. PP-F2F-G38]|nr:2-keto-3-deoxy-phosphogalactonate aldolase [Rhizobium sp. PP-WC-1G-195]PYE99685.1 2-keto-3-deoxy-phosphogalactonate aldolase [Rhizobium sp. PP-F2F-G38]